MKSILLVDYHKATIKVFEDFMNNYKIFHSFSADSALEIANENKPDLVVLELSLAGHSGLEFLNEFRTYSDWRYIPIIIYSSIRLETEVLKSKAWENLCIKEYFYKPETKITTLKSAIEKNMNT